MISPATSSGFPRRPIGICGRILVSRISFGIASHHLGADVARRDGVDRDALARHFERERLGEAVDAGLRGRIVGLAEGALLSVDRRDVDHATPAAVDHAVHHLLGHVEARVEVGAHHRVPVALAHLLERHVARDAGVVDEDVDRAHLRLDRRGLARAVVVVDHVDRKGAEAVAAAFHLLEPGSELGVGRRIRHHNAIAGVGHLGGNRLTQAAHAAGDDGDPLLCHELLLGERGVYIMCIPPLTEMLAPVM